MSIMLQRSASSIRPSLIRQGLDRVGIGLSGLCALHCLLSIVLVAGFGIGSEFLFAPAIHRYGLFVATLIAAAAIGWGAMRHRMAAPFMVALTGLAFMGAALIVPHGVKEVVLTIIGVVLVSLGHVFNIRHCNSTACKERCGD